jgi:hypothetical protein
MGDGAAVSTGLAVAAASVAGAALVGAALVGAVLAGAVLVGAVLVGAVLVGAVLVDTAVDDDPSVDGAGVGAASPPLAASAGSTSEFAGALLVAKSTVTFRVGSGALAGKIAAGVADGTTDLGPDNN